MEMHPYVKSEDRRKANEQARRLRQKRIAHGVCVVCEVAVGDKRRHCIGCAEYRAGMRRERRAARKARGACVACGVTTHDGKTCVPCRAKAKAHQSTFYLRLRAAELCLICRQPSTRKSRCSICYAKERERYRVRVLGKRSETIDSAVPRVE